MSQKRGLIDAVGELNMWLPSESSEYANHIFSLLASLPGGEEAENMGAAPFNFIKWQEAKMLGNLLVNLKSASDVEYATSALLIGYGEE